MSTKHQLRSIVIIYAVPYSFTAELIDPSSVIHTRGFGTAAVTRGSVTITTSAVVHTRAIGTARISSVVTPASVVHTRAIGTTVVTRGAVTVTPSAVVHTRTIGTVVVTQGAVSIVPTSVVHTRAFGTPSLSQVIYAGGIKVGPITAGTGAQSNQGPNWADWDTTVPSTFTSQDATVATVVVPTTGASASEDLILTNFGISMSDGKDPQGFEVDLVFRGVPAASEVKVYLTKDAGVASFIGPLNSLGNVGAGPQHDVMGDPNKNSGAGTWGAAITKAEVESSSFGLVIVVGNGEGSTITAKLDRVLLNVYSRGLVGHQRRIGPRLTATPGSVTTAPASVVHTRAFGTAAVTSGSTTLLPSSVVHTRAFGTLVVTVGAVTLSPSSVANTRAIGAATVENIEVVPQPRRVVYSLEPMHSHTF